MDATSRRVRSIYLMGSLRNRGVPILANAIEAIGIEAFDSWQSPGPDADDHWREYEKARGRTYEQALRGHSARHVFEFDRQHIERCDAAVLVMPAGKSAHLELGYALGLGKYGFILLPEEPERWDVMYQFADAVFIGAENFLNHLRGIV